MFQLASFPPSSPIAGLLTAILLAGCATPTESPDARQHRTAQLATVLSHQAPRLPRAQAHQLAAAAVEACATLRQNYRLHLNHNLHNLQVYWGIKKRGFCWHWQEDLQAALENIPHPAVEIRRIWAHPGSLWHEHHALLVTPKGSPCAQGIVLDPWRHEGVLWFGPSQTDHYPWLEE